MYKFFYDLYEGVFKEHSWVFKILAFFVLYKLILVIGLLSIMQWNTYPTKLVCSVETNSCKVYKYSYKHVFCWDEFLHWEEFFGKWHYYSRRYACKIPRQLDEEIDLGAMDSIADSKIKLINNKSHLFIVYKDGEEKEIPYTDLEYLNNLSKKIKNSIESYDNLELDL